MKKLDDEESKEEQECQVDSSQIDSSMAQGGQEERLSPMRETNQQIDRLSSALNEELQILDNHIGNLQESNAEAIIAEAIITE